MKNKLLTELTNKYIDNLLTPEEESTLNDLLKDEKSREYFNSMKSTFADLESLKPDYQNINLHDQIMNIILKQNNNSNMILKLRNELSLIFSGAKISYAITFACGVLLTAIFFLFQSPENQIDDTFMTGTISRNSFNETYYMDTPPLSGSIDVKYTPEVVIMDIHPETDEIIDCNLRYNNTLLSLYGVKNIGSGNNGNFSSGNNSIHLSNVGSNHYLVFFKYIHNNPSSVLASFYSGSMTLSNVKIEIKN